MKVAILGSGTAVPSLRRHSAAYLLQHRGENILFDCGYGALHQLLRLGLSYHDVDRIFFTHVHPDHISDLIPFLFATRYPEDPRQKELTLVGAPGFGQFFTALTSAFRHWLIPTEYPLHIIEQDTDTRLHGTLEATAGMVQHMDLSRAWRVRDPVSGKTLVFSGDTDYSPELALLAKDVDLLILECSFPDTAKVAGHLTPQEAGRLAHAAGCKKLCLTHFYPTMDPESARAGAAKEYAGEILLAEDLLAITV
jgi:ribonuclease BN (tRNA processing enzyme)